MVINFGKISRNGRIIHRYGKHVPLMCGSGSNMATMFRITCAKTSEKVTKGEHHDTLWIKPQKNLNLVT